MREKTAEVLADMNGKTFVGNTVNSLRELGAKGKPETIEELEERIDAFLDFCTAKNLRPGVEMLSSALGISRITFWSWCNGVGCSSEWSAVCVRTRQLISSFIECLTLNGHLSPPVGIFALKNVAGWEDGPREIQREEPQRKALAAGELPRLVKRD